MRKRRAGVLLHPTSLPGSEGIGTIGKSARHFIDFLSRTGFSLWQVLPLSPPAAANSPYSAYSAFAGNPMLIDLQMLTDEGMLTDNCLEIFSTEKQQYVDYETVIPKKEKLLRIAAASFFDNPPNVALHEFWEFCDTTHWLHDYALFKALKSHFKGKPWFSWPDDIKYREEAAFERYSVELGVEIGFQKFVQWQFFKQWKNLYDYAAEKGVGLIGDLPIFVNHDSADVWCNRELFLLDAEGRQTVTAGVPPDYFSRSGQLWGSPLYNWDAISAKGYSWWIARVKQLLSLFDLVRIDHFRGFESAWHVPLPADDAINGCWVNGPRESFFIAIEKEIGRLPFIAEDLGIITHEVERLRDRFCFPGMKILQFAFDSGADNPYIPHNHIPNCVVYTGTHDNDTTSGWSKTITKGTLQRISEYFRCPAANIDEEIVRAALMSVADTAIIPMQDLLKLGAEARMNIPGTVEGNWRWRLPDGQLTNQLEENIRTMLIIYGRTQGHDDGINQQN